MQVRLRLHLADASSFKRSPEYRCSRITIACDKRLRWNFLLVFNGGFALPRAGAPELNTGERVYRLARAVTLDPPGDMDGDKQHTFSSANAGNVSCVGNFDENGLNVNNWNGNRNDNVGVGASRHFHPLLLGNTLLLRRAFLLAISC